MAQILHRTQESFKGPWLIDKPAWEALDSILKEQWDLLAERKKKLIENAIQREKTRLSKQDWYNKLDEAWRKEENKRIRQEAEAHFLYAKDGCFITLTLATGTKVVESSFAKLATAQACQGQFVTKASVRIACGGVKIEMDIPREWNNSLSLLTLPEDSTEAQEAFTKLRMWVDEFRPDWLRVFNGNHPLGIWLHAFVLGIVIGFIALVVGSFNAGPSWRDEARELVEKGIQPDDYGRALEILLRKELPLTPGKGAVPIPFWLYPILVTITVVAILLSVPAYTVFEIGSGKDGVRWQKWYAGLLRGTIPAFLVMGVLTSAIGSFVFEYVKTLFSSP